MVSGPKRLWNALGRCEYYHSIVVFIYSLDFFRTLLVQHWMQVKYVIASLMNIIFYSTSSIVLNDQSAHDVESSFQEQGSVLCVVFFFYRIDHNLIGGCLVASQKAVLRSPPSP